MRAGCSPQQEELYFSVCVCVQGCVRFYMKQVLGIQKSLKTTNLPKHPYDVIFTFPLTSQPTYAPSPEAAHKFRQLLTARFQLTIRTNFSLLHLPHLVLIYFSGSCRTNIISFPYENSSDFHLTFLHFIFPIPP